MSRFTRVNQNSNLSMAMDAARRTPVLVDFFGNEGVLFSAERFAALTAVQLRDLQEELARRLNPKDPFATSMGLVEPSAVARAALQTHRNAREATMAPSDA